MDYISQILSQFGTFRVVVVQVVLRDGGQVRGELDQVVCGVDFVLAHHQWVWLVLDVVIPCLRLRSRQHINESRFTLQFQSDISPQ